MDIMSYNRIQNHEVILFHCINIMFVHGKSIGMELFKTFYIFKIGRPTAENEQYSDLLNVANAFLTFLQ